jgi:hypothetical protein
MRSHPALRPPRHRTARAAARTAALVAVLTAVLATVLTACAAQRDVLSEDRAHGREVALLTGTALPEPPADPRFRELTALQAEESLARLIVRPSKVVSFVRGDPQPFLSPEQQAWARDALATVLPRLKPDQRLQLRFLDRFQGFQVEAEVYAEGPALVYRFTRLAAQPEDPARGTSLFKPVAFVQLVERPGQTVSSDDYAYVLRDAVFGTVARGLSESEQLAELERAAAARGIAHGELEAARAALQGRPDITLEAIGSYVDKLGLVLRSREQGLFTDAEAAERKQRLLHELTARR